MGGSGDGPVNLHTIAGLLRQTSVLSFLSLSGALEPPHPVKAVAPSYLQSLTLNLCFTLWQHAHCQEGLVGVEGDEREFAFDSMVVKLPPPFHFS